jgi:tRNA(Ile)-lysidine synthase TilS/MesJ
MQSLRSATAPERKYDVLVPLSGGVDSSVVLIELVRDYSLRVLAFHYDHGFELPAATENARNLCKALHVDLVIEQKDYAFMKTLWKHANESAIKGLNSCFICGNILYANALSLAEKLDIPIVINGYSKGQTELVLDRNSGLTWVSEFIKEVTEKGDFDFIDSFLEKMRPLQNQAIIADISCISSKLPENKRVVIPFYMFEFNKTDKEYLKKICREVFNWQQPENTYPKRTTNCIMNWLNNYFDIKRLGYTNYHEEYSVLIRSGEMTREQAMDDLEFVPPHGLLDTLAKEIGMSL